MTHITTEAAPESTAGHGTDDATGIHTLPDGLPLELGGALRPCRLAWRLAGPAGAPVVAVMGGISADRNPWGAEPGSRGWWEDLVGPGRAVDVERVRVLAFDWVGGAGRSTPASDGPGTLPLTPADQARALAELATHLGVCPLHAVVGASYGGAVALALAARHPATLRRGLVIGAAHRSHPMATALRVVQRRIVELAGARGRVAEGLALARALAMTTYRSAREFEVRFAGPPVLDGGAPRFPVEDYLDHRGRAFAERFTPGAFLCLSRSLDLHAVDPGRVAVPLTLVSVDPDAVAPRWQMRELHRGLGPGHAWVEVDSLRGHDAFLTDVPTFDGILRRFLAPEASRGAAAGVAGGER